MKETTDNQLTDSYPDHIKCGLDEALEDIKAGRVIQFESLEELFKDLGI